jgi:putative MATE family efflux protein
MKTRDMTQGDIWRQMVFYAIPIFCSQVLQQLYNAFDAAVVGRYVSSHALAAVGASGPLINMIISFFMGLSMGASVIISQSFGAKDGKTLSEAAHTAMSLSLWVGLALSAIGFIVTPAMLGWISTPPEVMADATLYLRIFFAGASGLTIYNMGAGILRAVGDSQRPLYFLALTAALNIAGNLLFVIVFQMGIAGVGYATIIAQFISAALVVWVLHRETGDHRLYFSRLRIHLNILKRVLRIGLPAAIQHGLISFSNVFVQSYINKLGSAMMAGYSAASKIDAFVMLPGMSMAMTTTTFVGQNLGARQVPRARQGVRWGLGLGVGLSILTAGAGILAARPLLRIFTVDAAVIANAYDFVLVMAASYFLMTFSQVLPGALRGAGDVNFATITGIVTFVGLRQVWLYFATQVSHTAVIVALGFPVSWFVAAVALAIYYRKSDWRAYEPDSTPTPEAR